MLYISHTYGKGKSKYSLLGNLWYCIKSMWEWKRTAVAVMLSVFLPTLLARYGATLLPAVMVQDLERQQGLRTLVLHIAGLSVLMWAGETAGESARTWIKGLMPSFLQHFRKKFTSKIMDLDYDILEAPERRETIGNVIAALQHGRGLYAVPDFLVRGTSALVLLAVYAVLIARAGLWLLGVVMVTVVANYALVANARKKYTEYYGENSRHALRMDYISSQASDATAGKDIRLYRLLGLFLSRYDESLKEMDRLFGRIHFWYHIRGTGGSFLNLLRSGVIYGTLIYLLTEGKISASGLVYYGGLLGTFTNYFNWLVYLLLGYNSGNVSIGYIRDFLSWENDWKQPKDWDSEKIKRREPARLELRHVSYSYPGSAGEVLKDVNLVLEPGEKLALLGLNGAGKTTLTKLICGFYQPTQGEILLNGISIREYPREEYYSLLSVLFQDHTILPFTLDENLTGGEAGAADKARLWSALELSGFRERYERLPEKGRTKLVREVQQDSVDFSGGEYQKFLFARTLYQQASLIILDEPTAALDPIAENELYQNFGEAVKNATVIYISHRLASTRFCDRIVLLEDGRIVEEGTHESLMEAGGRYARLYEMQGRYYK